MQPIFQPRYHYNCQCCGTANTFQPWALGKKNLVRCPHCRQLNKLPYGSNPMQALVALLSVFFLLLLPWLIWTYLSQANNAWLY